MIESQPASLLGGPVTCLTEGLTFWCKITPDDGVHDFHPKLSVLIEALRSQVVGEGTLANTVVKNWYNLPSVKSRRVKGNHELVRRLRDDAVRKYSVLQLRQEGL